MHIYDNGWLFLHCVCDYRLFTTKLQVRLSNPIELINGSKKGEKKGQVRLLKNKF
jgi:hypothetical protein